MEFSILAYKRVGVSMLCSEVPLEEDSHVFLDVLCSRRVFDVLRIFFVLVPGVHDLLEQPKHVPLVDLQLFVAATTHAGPIAFKNL